MFPYVSHWKRRGSQGIHLIIRTKDGMAFALLKERSRDFFVVFSTLPLIDILETNMLNFPIANIVIFVSLHEVKS